MVAPAGRGSEDSRDPSPGRRLLWVIAALVWGVLAAALVSFDPADPPSHAVAPLHGPDEVANWIGPVGAAVSYWLLATLGSGTWLLVGTVGAFLGYVAFRGPINHPVVRLVGVSILALAVSALHALAAPRASVFPEGAGGLLAIAGLAELTSRFGALGALAFVLAAAAVGATVAYDRWLVVVPRAIGAAMGSTARTTRSAAGRLAGSARAARANDVDDDAELSSLTRFLRRAAARTTDGTEDEADAVAAGRADRKRRRAERARLREEELARLEDASAEYEDEDEDGEWEYEYEDDPEAEYEEDGSEEEDAEEEEEDAGVVAVGAGEEPDVGPDAPKVFSEDALREKISKLPLRFASAQQSVASEDDLDALRAARRSEEEADRKYAFPGLDLLEDPEANFVEEMEQFLREQAEALENALRTYRIDGEVVGIDSGPVITLFQVSLAPGTKVSSVTSVSSDIARMLKATNIRIVPNTEGLDTVGIEVPNLRKEKVRLKELMAQSEATNRMKLPLFLGKDASGEPLIADLAALPHMLIAGTTGSGKSVCMNAIIMGFLYTQKPSDLKLVLVDPKMVELSQFKDIPHLMCPVVTEMAKAAAILEWAVGKMDERYELLAEAGCRDISAYNALGWEELKDRLRPGTELEEARIPRKLPYMVFVIDELADLMMTNKEVEGAIVRIAQKARAVGIHLILATQRPQANVVTGLIKSNMPGRVAFKVASGMDSRIVLDQKGAELLLGQGDMLMLTPRSSATQRAQGTLVDDSEIRAVVRFVRDHSAQNFEGTLVTIGDSGYETQLHEERMREHAQEDPLFDRAVELVLESRRGSVSMLQRQLAIGYTRSARLIEMMGEAGLIGSHKGTVAREVTMTLEEWHALKAIAEQEPGAGDGEEPRLFPEPAGEAAGQAEGPDAGRGAGDADVGVDAEAPATPPADDTDDPTLSALAAGASAPETHANSIDHADDAPPPPESPPASPAASSPSSPPSRSPGPGAGARPGEGASEPGAPGSSAGREPVRAPGDGEKPARHNPDDMIQPAPTPPAPTTPHRPGPHAESSAAPGPSGRARPDVGPAPRPSGLKPEAEPKVSAGRLAASAGAAPAAGDRPRRPVLRVGGVAVGSSAAPADADDAAADAPAATGAAVASADQDEEWVDDDADDEEDDEDGEDEDELGDDEEWDDEDDDAEEDDDDDDEEEDDEEEWDEEDDGEEEEWDDEEDGGEEWEEEDEEDGENGDDEEDELAGEYEYEYVDEDGNPIDPATIDPEEYEVTEEKPEPTPASAKRRTPAA